MEQPASTIHLNDKSLNETDHTATQVGFYIYMFFVFFSLNSIIKKKKKKNKKNSVYCIECLINFAHVFVFLKTILENSF